MNLARRRRLLRALTRAFQAVFLRVAVRGLEHIPPDGPLLVLFNHLSSLDGPLVVANFPHELELVGPGDFRLAWPGPLAVRAYGMTLIRRGRPDRQSLRTLIAHLKAGRRVAMAPEGGTWEKGITGVKPGAAYLSQVTGAPMLPVALGGIYGVEDAALQLKRPRVTVTFGPLMPPVPPSRDRRRRDADLEEASRAIMQRLYDLLPPEDRALYDRWGRARYALRVDFARLEDGTPLALEEPLPDLSALASFIARPNLFRPMWQNARLSVEPFRERRFFAPLEVKIAARELMETLAAGDYADYLAYRLGDAQAVAVMADLEALRALCDLAMAHHARLRLVPVEAVGSSPTIEIPG